MARQLSPRTRTALRQLDRAQRQLAQARAELHAAIVAELADDYPPTQLAAAVNYTTAGIRKIARAAGIPPARRGPA
jgi:hypothetical protein